MESLSDWLSRLEGVKKSGRGYVARCPAHDDRNPSLSVWDGEGGGVGAKCFVGCAYKDIRAALGFTGSMRGSRGGGGRATRPVAVAQPPKPEVKPERLPRPNETTRVWHYAYKDGSRAFAVVRRDPLGRKKTFSQWTPTKDPELWIPRGLPKDRPLYRLPKLAAANRVVVVEGEKCADAVLASWNVPVTTWAGGTGAWQLTDWTPLTGKQVTVVADADPDAPPDKPNAKSRPGQEAALHIAALLYSLDCDVKVAIPEPDLDDDGNSRDIADWLAEGTDYARRRVGELLTEFTPDMAPRKPEEPNYGATAAIAHDKLSANPHYRILGLHGSRIAVRIAEAGVIDTHSRPSMTQIGTLIDIAPLVWWSELTGEELSPRIARHVGDGIIRAADRLGQVDLTHTYGRGAAKLPDGQIVYHLGDRLLVNGSEIGLDSDTYNWLAEPRIELAAAAKPKQAMDIADAIMQYRWEDPMHGQRMLGWIVAAIVGGALEWRPHITLNASSGAGKSWLLDNLLTPLMGTLLQRIADASPAALARLTAHASLPVAVDEAEPSSEWVLELLSLLRIASGAAGMRIRADTANGGIQIQSPRFSAILSSVAVPRLTRADASRQSEVRLGAEVSDWPAVRDGIRAAMKHADGVRTLIIRDAEQIAAYAEELAAEYQEAGWDSREALASGALTAGWQWWGVDTNRVLSQTDDDRKRTDATDLLYAILEMQVRTPANVTKSLARALYEDYRAIEDLYGVLYDERGILIHYNHNGLTNGLSRTQWGRANLRGILMQLPNSYMTPNPIRIGARRARALVVPPETLAGVGIDLMTYLREAEEQEARQ